MKKKYLIFGVIIGIYVILTVVLLLIKNANDKRSEKHLIIDQYGWFTEKKNNWSTFSKREIKNFLFDKYDIYDGQTYLGNYKLQYNDRWYLWDDNHNSVQYEDKILAYKGEEKLYLNPIKEAELNSNDNDIINSALKKINVNSYSTLSTSKKYSLDLNGDNVNEYIYIVSNTNSFNEPDKYFSVIFINANNNIEIIKKGVGSIEESLQLPRFSLEYNISFGKEFFDHILISTIYFSKPDKTQYSMYKFNKNKLELVIENK